MRHILKTMGMLVCLAIAISFSLAAASGSGSDRVVYNRNGNMLLLYGGDKSRTIEDIIPSPIGLTRATKTISDSQTTYYGDRYVKTYFTSTVECDIWWSYPMWAEVSGSTTTAWYGTDPQYYSSEIKLSEQWIFGGYSITLSYPGGVGFSGSSKTISWSAHDTSGNYWRMSHVYSGIRGESSVLLTSVRQNSLGSHKFNTTNTWVSAYATDGCSTA